MHSSLSELLDELTASAPGIASLVLMSADHEEKPQMLLQLGDRSLNAATVQTWAQFAVSNFDNYLGRLSSDSQPSEKLHYAIMHSSNGITLISRQGSVTVVIFQNDGSSISNSNSKIHTTIGFGRTIGQPAV